MVGNISSFTRATSTMRRGKSPRTDRSGEFFLKPDDRWHKFRPRQGDGERGFSPENKIPAAGSIYPLI